MIVLLVLSLLLLREVHSGNGKPDSDAGLLWDLLCRIVAAGLVDGRSVGIAVRRLRGERLARDACFSGFAGLQVVFERE